MFRFPQYGQIGLIFHDDREPESFFQLFTQILLWQRIIGSEADPVLMDHTVDAHSHAYNAVRRILILRQVLRQDFGQKIQETILFRKRIFLYPAVFSLEI